MPSKRYFFIVNPAAGSMKYEQFIEQLDAHFQQRKDMYTSHRTAEGEDLTQVARQAVGDGYDVVVACGGDGTVALAASGLIGSQVPMGIIPSGTGNVLSKSLNLPQSIEPALKVLTGKHRLQPLDAMQVGERDYFLSIGVGLSADTMQSTSSLEKQQFGVLAYIWNGMRVLAGFQFHRFWLQLDDHKVRFDGIEVHVTKTSLLGSSLFQWDTEIRPDDGKMAIKAVRGRTVWDYLQILLDLFRADVQNSRQIRSFYARELVEIASNIPLPVQADGEVIGKTPVEVRLKPEAVVVLVPADEPAE